MTVIRSQRHLLSSLLQRSIRCNRRQCASSSSSSSSGGPESTVYDVVIHGGGVVGATVAADLLVRTNGRCKVCLIEANPTRAVTTSQPDPRVYTLAPRSISILERIGAWEGVAARSHPYSSMQIWESTGPGIVKFRSSDVQKPELGRICEDATIQSSLYKCFERYSQSIDILNRTSIVEIKLPSIANKSSFAELLVKNSSGGQETEQRISTRLLVAADGANSLVRRLTGIPSWGWGYGQEAVVASVSLLDSTEREPGQGTHLENATAWQRYLPTGPLALLPCWNGYSSIVWSVPVTEARRLKALSPEDFLSELNAALRAPIQSASSDRWSSSSQETSADHETTSRPRGLFPPWVEAVLGGPISGLRKGSREVLKGVGKEITAASEALLSMAQLRDPYSSPPKIKALSGPRLSFPLNFQQAKYYALDRCVLVGDAAHSIHPQAGQGLNLGLQDAVALSSRIVQALECGQDIGSQAVLQDYANERYAKNLAMMSIVDIINAAFKDSLSIGGPMAAAADHPGSSDSPAVAVKRFLRSAGMLGIHNSSMLKAAIAKFAMGTE